MALLQEEADRCTGCGHLLSETTAADAMGAYTAKVLTCEGCRAGQYVTEKNAGRGDHVYVIRKPDTPGG